MKKGVSQKISNEALLQAIIDMGENVGQQIREINEKMATKVDLEKVRQELLAEIRPIGRAVDKDALSIINHEKRITRLEKQVLLK